MFLYPLLFILGISVGMVSAALGVGGGILMVPAFVEFVPGMDRSTAIGTSLFTIIFVAALNAWRLNRGHRRQFHGLAAMLAGGTVVAAYAGGWMATWLDEDLLAWIFAVLAGLLALRTFALQTPPVGEEEVERGTGARFGLSLSIGLVTGLISGMTGIGGGGILVPLVLWARLVPNSRVTGLSNSVMILTCASGSLAFMQAESTAAMVNLLGQIHWPTALLVFVGAQVGSPIGKWINAHLTLRRRKIVMGALLIVIMVRTIWRALAA